LNILGDSRPGIGLAETFKPDIIFCDVPEGEIQINSINFNVKKFYIAKYTITYSQFEPFLQSIDGFRNILWWKDIPSEYQFQEMDQQNNKQDNHPREKVSWYQAIAFSRWLNEKLKINGNLTFLNSNVDYISLFNNGWSIRLPTEWEFQQAATGGNVNYSYPWGEAWEDNKTNTAEAIIGRTTAVGIFPSGVSPTGAMDLSGNVWEWCLNEFRDTRETGIGGENARVLRGGSFSRSKEDAKVSARNFDDPFFRYGSFGFRVCFAPSVAQH
jgi:formylglycine-generating enzyme required for sulfatase activity